jgi:hypothetical protein
LLFPALQKSSTARHSREGGNPPALAGDSRLRGNDDFFWNGDIIRKFVVNKLVEKMWGLAIEILVGIWYN